MALIDRRVLLCLVVLVLNDRWLKAAHPSWVTGKLSDVAGIVVFAVVIAALLHWFGVAERAARRAGLLIAGCALASVKLSTSAAAAVVAALEATTGVAHTIVVDATDLVALLALPVASRIMACPRTPKFFNEVDTRRVRVVAFSVACLAFVSSSVDEGPFLTHVDTNDAGQVVVGTSESEGVRSVFVFDESGSPDRSGEADDAVDWSLTTESCNPVDPSVCLSVGPETAINVSTDGGVTYAQEWAIDDWGWWHFERNTEATDIEWLPDGTAYVAVTSMNPIRRSVDGAFTPSIGDLHPFPIVVVGFVLAGWLIAMESAFFADRRRSAVGAAFFRWATLVALGAALIAASGGFGALAAISVGVPLIAVCLVAGYIAFAVQHSADRRDGVEIVPRGRAPWWAFVWPIPVIVLAGWLWDVDLIPWVVALGMLFGSAVIGWSGLWLLRREPTA